VGKLTGYLYHEISLREWVDHVPSAKLEDMTLRLVNRLAYKQAIKKITHPEKARKLIIAGLHECKRTLWTTIDKKKSKLLIIALNIERNDLERGTDDQMQQVLSYAYEANVPVVHISTRAKIGRAFTGKFGPRISMLSVINYEGYQDMMELIMEEWKEMKNIYDTTNKYMFKF
jgi:ribosomal protein L7Ae-like RNA K-turn-binding protein